MPLSRPTSSFFAAKYAGLPASAPFDSLPFLTKAELVADQAEHPPYGTRLDRPAGDYVRLHQTSGTTTGKPLVMLDTAEGWDWLLDCWMAGFKLAGIAPSDRLFFPFSFGPFLGFWTAFEAGLKHGNFCLTGGGMSTAARLNAIVDHAITVIFCTPTYALHLAEAAGKENISLAASSVRKVVVAGEPGGSIPAVRARIESGWGAAVVDHYGLTEVGPTAFEPADGHGDLVVLDDKFFAEVIDRETLIPTPAGEIGELVLTNLGRVGNSVVRYRTGDLVRPALERHPAGLRLLGGILGRADDMLHVRGNNLYPTAIEAIVRRFTQVVEYRLIVDDTGPLTDLRLDLECRSGDEGTTAEQVRRAIQSDLLFRVEVRLVPSGTLDRFEMKARRLVRIGKSYP